MEWLHEISAAVTVCDEQGIIVYMNETSGNVFKNDGGTDLIGTNLFDCHPEPALTKLKALMSEGRTNIYTVEKNGKKKMIYQAPWRTDNAIAGMIEISFELPEVMEHFVRK